MKIFKKAIFLIIFVLLNLINLIKGQGGLTFFSGGNFNLLGLLPSNTIIAINVPNVQCISNDQLSIEGIEVGYGGSTNITLDILAPITLRNDLDINFNNTVYFNIPPGGLGIMDDHVDVSSINLNQQTSKMINMGSMSGKNSSISIKGGYLNNKSKLNMKSILNTGGSFITDSSSQTSLANFQSVGGDNFIQGEIIFASSDDAYALSLSTQSHSTLYNAQASSSLKNFKISTASTFNMESSYFSMNRIDQDQGSISLQDQSTISLSSKSGLDLFNFGLVIKDSTALNVSSSTITTDSNFRVLSTANLLLKEESSLISSSPMLIRNFATVNINSKSNVESKILYISEESNVNVDDSILTVGYSSNDRGGSSSSSSDSSSTTPTPSNPGIIIKSSIQSLTSSSLGVSNFMGLSDKSILSINNSSKLNVKGLFALLNETTMSVDSSSVLIEKTLYSFNNSTIGSFNSTFNISDTFDVNDDSKFKFIDSNLLIEGSFKINSDKKVSRQFINSDVKVDGKFLNFGTIQFNASRFDLNRNFTSVGLVNSIGSNIKVKNGQFNVLGYYIGESDEINLTNGQMQIGPKSNFKCSGCSITSIGNIRQAKSSTLKLFDSTFNNNGVGDLSVSKNSVFQKLNQYNGAILSLINNVEIHSNSTIDLQGGSIVGMGLLNTTINNQAGTIGNNNITKLDITGNYTQGIGGTIIVTIDSINELSTFNIQESVNILGGNLIIRLNKQMVEDKSNQGQPMSVMTSNQEMNASFNSIQFKTYDPSSGEETDQNDDCRYQTKQTKSTLAVLLGSDCDTATNDERGLTTPQIIGIAFAGFGVILVASLITTYVVFQKYRYSENSIKLKKWVLKFKA
ncbi:hypothetical protein DDB_G0282131 [Dictyostelium discoideum AX4]|uniref:Uncharacterized protein n=1 Tax=Dictyostelium discoideum TaxID=44689 RepID=Q54T00_DICDI|nr:hypothetical protein DDB_G0282131 [Dictyostelium discoideum AX4]EAL66391.1 hypothetical protein DDB_G0282131 [Dictyostelium discoideum AX4]|eukprot:XP_640355.1 hypothetical protein DDB_G0282131 [Dictyostelium discoideum AX4]